MRRDEQVAGRLRRAVGGGRLKRRVLGEGAVGDRAVDLVGRDLHVAGDAELTRGLEQHAGADHVSAGERLLVGDRAVDVRLGGEVHDRVAARERVPDGVGILGRALDELDPVLHFGQVLAPPRIGELVEDHNLVAAVEREADVAGPDEPGTAGDKELHRG